MDTCRLPGLFPGKEVTGLLCLPPLRDFNNKTRLAIIIVIIIIIIIVIIIIISGSFICPFLTMGGLSEIN